MLLRVEAVRCGLELIDYSCASGLLPSDQRCVSAYSVWHCCRGPLAIDIELSLALLCAPLVLDR